MHGDVIVIALTFGNQSDWSRNVRAAGGRSIRVNGRDYHATNPQFISREDAGDLSLPVQPSGMGRLPPARHPPVHAPARRARPLVNVAP